MSSKQFVGTLDGFIKGWGSTFGRLHYVGPAPQPVREDPISAPARGLHETPEEWWEAQADFYGCPVPPFPGH